MSERRVYCKDCKHYKKYSQRYRSINPNIKNNKNNRSYCNSPANTKKNKYNHKIRKSEVVTLSNNKHGLCEYYEPSWKKRFKDWINYLYKEDKK